MKDHEDYKQERCHAQSECDSRVAQLDIKVRVSNILRNNNNDMNKRTVHLFKKLCLIKDNA